MITIEEKQQIKQKLKSEGINGSTLAIRFGVSRQMVNGVLNGTLTSQKVENKLRKYLYGE